MERRAQAAESLLARSSGKEALDHAIRAAELYMNAAAEASSKADANRCHRRCKELIAFAENLKAHLNTAPSTNLQILRQASRLHGNEFPPWEAEPAETEFQLLDSEEQFIDDAVFTLSSTQAENFAAWTRPMELFSLSPQLSEDIKRDPGQVFMQSTASPNLVQDVTTDCSVVASLSAAIEVLTGKHSVLSTVIYPFDYVNDRPKLSPSGKYVVRMNFNGCSRRVVIDDRLPTSHTDRTLFVVDRQNPHLIWPALLEKAYLKIRGGYDFPGSNSGTDLWVLMGWIPEQVFLHSDEFDIDETWMRIITAHEAQDVVITLGTGRVSAEEEEVMGLIGEHDYAVQNVDSTGGTRRLLIKNPWCNGPVWTRASWSASRQQTSQEVSINPASNDGRIDSLLNGTLWVDFEDVAQHFESMYLNWNPGLFFHRQDHHFTWEIPPKYQAPSLVRNPQFCLTSPDGGLVWILVSRHFVDAELDIARNKKGSMADVAQELGFMSILVFEGYGRRMQVKGEESYQGPLVDSQQTLARLNTKSGMPNVIVIDQCSLALPSYTFTLSVFSQRPVEMTEARERMNHIKECVGTWNRRTAGGHSGCTTFFQNPQYKLAISQATPISILLSTDGPFVQVHVDILWAQGRRATNIRMKDLVASSGEYHKGCAVAEIPRLDPGAYTVVCSTFDPGQMANFIIRVAAMVPVVLEPAPAGTAGMLRTPLGATQLPRGEERRRAPISVAWLTRGSVSVVGVVLSSSVNDNRQSSSAMIRVSVVHGWGPNQVILTESGEGEFQDSVTAIRTPEFDLEPDRIRRDGMWVVIESLGIHNSPQGMDGEIFSDSPVEVGPWESVWV